MDSLGITRSSTASEVAEQLELLAQQQQGKMVSRLKQAAAFAAEEGLNGTHICGCSPEDIVDYFEESKPLSVNKATAKLMLELDRGKSLQLWLSFVVTTVRCSLTTLCVATLLSPVVDPLYM